MDEKHLAIVFNGGDGVILFNAIHFLLEMPAKNVNDLFKLLFENMWEFEDNRKTMRVLYDGIPSLGGYAKTAAQKKKAQSAQKTFNRMVEKYHYDPVKLWYIPEACKYG